MLLAVLAVNEPGTLRLALGPKTIPAGFISNKLGYRLLSESSYQRSKVYFPRLDRGCCEDRDGPGKWQFGFDRDQIPGDDKTG